MNKKTKNLSISKAKKKQMKVQLFQNSVILAFIYHLGKSKQIPIF